jgi:2'-5' RNA ligase
MSALSDLLLNQAGGRPLNGKLDDELRRPGTVYFAFKPDPIAADQAAEIGSLLCARHGLTGNVSQEVLHVTICPIGHFPDLPEERVEIACKVAGALIAKPFEIMLDRIRTYPNGREKLPLVAFAGKGVPAAKLFRHALAADLRRAGIMIAKNLPDPHMTLFYDRRVVIEEPIAPISWTVREFVLVHSIQGEGRHKLLGQWPLKS